MIKNKIETLFEKFGHLIFRHRIKTLIFMFAFIGLLISQIPPNVDTSSEGMLYKNDPGRIKYNHFRDQFGNSGIIVIGIKTPDIFDKNFLKKLKSLHEDLENKVPFVHEVTSLINARNTYGEGDTLYVDDLLEGFPDEDIDLSKIKKLATNNILYRNNIISNDRLMTALVIETEASIIEGSGDEDALEGFDDEDALDETGGVEKQEGKEVKRHYFSAEENTIVVDALEDVLKKYSSKDFIIVLAGGPVVVEIYNRVTKTDMGRLLIAAVVMIIVFLYILFRRITGVIFPLLIVLSALFSTFGIMAISGLYITLFTVVLPSFLIAVGIADAVHVLAIFYRHYQDGNSKEDAIAFALGHSGLAIIMTSLTTAAGLMSFSFSELCAISELGMIAASGVIIALIYTIILLPAFLAVFPIKRKDIKVKNKTGLMDRVLLSFADFSTSHPVKIMTVSLILFVLSVYGVLKLEFSHNLLDYYPDYMKIKGDVATIDDKFRGALVIEVVLDTKKENGVYDPDFLNRVESISQEIEKIDQGDIFVGKVLTINDILKETHQALHGNDAAFYKIPQNKKTIAQEFLLFENSGSDDLEKIVDSQFTKTRVSIKISWVDLVVIDRFLGELEERFNHVFKDKAEVTITGMTTLMGRTITAAIHSMAQSYIIAFIVITVLMIVLVGDIKIGLLSMIPNLLPIFIVMGLIGFLRVPLDLTSLMIGSIAIGLVVDDTMHFMYNFRKYYDITGDAKKAVQETLLGTGRAILITSVVLSSSFFILMIATLENSDSFGLFTGIVIILALLADFLLAPALMVMVTRKRGANNI
jgi:predicted RND superfamily exporter protein